ncbi:sulfatase family protein [Thiolapillus sp.]
MNKSSLVELSRVIPGLLMALILLSGCSGDKESNPSRPNILFILSDQQHYQAYGLQDSSFHTPSIDELAHQSRSFSHAFVTAPQCSPSRASIYTGLYPHRTGVTGNTGSINADGSRITGLRKGIKTAGGYLKEAGYYTAYIGKWHLGPVNEHQAEYELRAFDTVKGGDDTTDEEKTEKALAFLMHPPKNQPFALFLNYREPHNIYDFGGKQPPQPSPELEKGMALPDSFYREDFATKPAAQTQYMEINPARRFLDAGENTWKSYRGYYRQRVQHFDEQLGRILQALKKQHLEQNTLLMVTSDHGDMDAQHRLVFKGPFMYEQLVRVPLFIRLPKSIQGLPPGTDDGLTNNVDLLPTLLDLAGVKVQGLDGKSLMPRLTGKGVSRQEQVVSEYQNKQKWNHPLRMIRTPAYKFVDHLVGMDELYDLKKDPEELHNLVNTSAYTPILKKLARDLEQWRSRTMDPFHNLSATDPEGRRITPGTELEL